MDVLGSDQPGRGRGAGMTNAPRASRSYARWYARRGRRRTARRRPRSVRSSSTTTAFAGTNHHSAPRSSTARRERERGRHPQQRSAPRSAPNAATRAGPQTPRDRACDEPRRNGSPEDRALRSRVAQATVGGISRDEAHRYARANSAVRDEAPGMASICRYRDRASTGAAAHRPCG